VITKKTVLVLGAGASKPYSFPTGTELIFHIANDFSSPNAVRVEKIMPHEYRHFVDELRKAQPYSIDEFLENHPSLANIGKKAIAMHLLPSEYASQAQMEDISKKDHWYRYLKAAMNAPFSLWGQNQLRIITFNYDRSLEYYLFRAVKGSYEGVDDAEYAKTLNQISILHVYGRLGSLDWQSQGSVVRYGNEPDYSAEEIEDASRGIKVLHDGTDDEVLSNFIQAQEWLEWADRVLFLGFGFHEDNAKRLNLAKVLRPTQTISGTSYGLDNTRRSQVEYCTEWAERPERLHSSIPGRCTIRFPDNNAKCYDFLYNYEDLS